ncbi:Vesicle-trafficking protein SEC22c [Merluccius polli]|uniref:Vesicle-trafficking protein SEC22c n=1 Tax=Merluccius polli TaxID=89951 RepID=A0AA47N8D0_MERPO|nr:Vesicle-trafficking protein SEC22c [Merluccius polli]
MPMILFAFVVRVRDGLPLSASTDFAHNRELQERKQQLRKMSKALGRLPERGSVRGQDLNIYFVCTEGVSYMAVCHRGLSVAKAFCFLEDLCWAFKACFDSTAVSLAARPYPFLEFGEWERVRLSIREWHMIQYENYGTIQKLKQQYNKVGGGPALEITLAEVQEDLKRQPPKALTLEELELSNGLANGHVEQGPGSGQTVRLEAVTPAGILSLVLNIMCASLNLIRGVHLIEYTFQDDYDALWSVVAFLLGFVCCLFQLKVTCGIICKFLANPEPCVDVSQQCHLYLSHSSRKRFKSVSLLGVLLLCNLYLFGLRNAWQLLFHTLVACLSTGLILSRKVLDRSNDCGV